jgi:toxin YoeB
MADFVIGLPRWDPKALAEYEFCLKHDKAKANRINQLIKSIREDGPFKGLGKPEPLKWDLHGCWSRRIDDRNRLVYEVSGTDKIHVHIRFCGTHYE